MDPFISTPDQFAALIKADLAKFARIIKTGNIKLEQ
jgi:tripartite-type tricarboxylate transporter receptor subunit TctC